ncbi:hypothetical protein BG005_009825 [Podila minutissima]|nr:hypothetical protein BG005_009825 [Podila minutissima]
MADKKKSPGKHHPSRSVGTKCAMTRIILTNYRICLVAKSDQDNGEGEEDHGDDVVLVQVVLGSIASMDLDDEQRLLLVLKFESLQYTILQDPVPPGPPVTGEIFSGLRRVVFGGRQGIEGRFPFVMGPVILLAQERAMQEQGDGKAMANLWTAEEIYSVPVDASVERSRKDKKKHDKKDDLVSTDVLLGWAGGYDIQKEFERLRFRTKHWSVEDINMNFQLSPTTPTDNNRHSMPAPPPPLRNRITGELPPGPHCYYSGVERTVMSVPRIDSPEARKDRLQKLVSFRSNARFPMISWKSPRSGLMLMRCSQPMVGFLGARGPEDELYIRMILETAAEEHSRSASIPKLCIMDARAYSSAVANGYIGGGRENANPYFRTIQGLRVLIEKEWAHAGHPFQSRTDSNASQAKQFLTPASPVVGEKADSWRTPIIHSSPNGAKESLSYSSVSPKWRSRPGLSEQDPKLDPQPIPSFSYHMSSPPTTAPDQSPTPTQQQQRQQFRYPPPPPPPPVPSSASRQAGSNPISNTPVGQRSPHTIPDTPYPPAPSKPATTSPLGPATQSPPSPIPPPPPPRPSTVAIATSPVFILFLTCLHHIVQQHPNHFEYNDYLLVTLARAQGGVSPFGDFFFNSELERCEARLRDRTASIWSWVQRNRGWFTNRDYVPPRGSVLLPGRQGSRGGEEKEDADPESWRKDVLSVQTGGRFLAVWAEYYFDATPAWFPDPRHVFTESVESLSGDGREKGEVSVLVQGTRTCGDTESGRQPTTTRAIARRNRRKIKDPWCASLFDPVYIQQLVFPGFAAQQQQQQQNSGSSAHAVQASPLLLDSSPSSASPESRVVIPPALALLKGPEMHAYYTLVQYLRTKRRAQVQAAFEAWHAWAAKRVAAKLARDAGWGLVGKEDDDDYVEDMLRKPRLVVAARKGVQVEMDRIIQAGPFFGSGPVEFEEETEEEVQEQDEEEEEDDDGEQEEKDGDLCDIGAVSDEVDGFDDFGFPVESP